jgi:hypothetical protein
VAVALRAAKRRSSDSSVAAGVKAVRWGAEGGGAELPRIITQAAPAAARHKPFIVSPGRAVREPAAVG